MSGLPEAPRKRTVNKGTVDWPAVAKRLGYISEKRMWEVLYEHHQMGLPELALRFGIGKSHVRTALLRNRIPLRGRGQKRRHSPILSLSEVAALRKEGLKAAAARLNISYYEIRKRVHAALDYHKDRA